MIGIIYISIFIGILLIGTIKSIYARDKYEAEISFAIVVFLYFLALILFFILFNLSVENYFGIEVSEVLWKFSIFIRIYSIGLFSSIHIVEVHKHSKIKFLAIIIYFFLEGIIISLLFFPDSFLIAQQNSNYLYFFRDNILLIFILIFNLTVILFLWISQIMGYNNYNDKKLGFYNTIFIILITLNLIFYSIFLITQNIILRNLHVISYLINSTFLLYVVIKKPALFLVLTNKIYDFIIFHKSGILLYSYNFQTNKEVDESLLKGSILIA